jgi:acyl-coenzyme A synthetase/AMP-(fatty) acid ligase
MALLESLWDDNVRQNGISDDRCFVNYGDVLKDIQNLNQYFTAHKLKITQCVFLEVNNTIDCVIIMLYFFSKKVNVFLASPNLLNSGTVPAFCDKILVLKDRNDSSSLQLQLSENASHTDRGDFENNSGMVILASSGSIAAPKYIYYKAENIFKNAAACIQHFNINKDSQLLISVPVCHMYGLGAGFLPGIMAGANVSIINKPNVIKLIDKLRIFKPTISLINPTFCKMLLQLNKTLSQSNTYISAGEPLDSSLRTEFINRYGHLINLYGCSELGAMATSGMSLQDKVSFGEKSMKPVNGVEFKIKKTGNSNEILCKNPYGFEFYLDEYGKKMNDQPFEDGWYRTKDAGRIDHTGNLEVVGRIDLCINRSGFLLSLEELEVKLENLLESVNKIVTIETSSKELLAICELKNNYILDTSSAKNTCLRNLPRYAVPDHFYFTESIPRLYNGKPDRKHLTFLYT